MAFIRTIQEDEATGLVRQLYDQDLATDGYVNNTTKVFSLHPEVAVTWSALGRAIRSNMDPRRYELVTVAAAVELRSTYCTLAHGSLLRTHFYSAEQVEAIVRDFRHAGLQPVDVAIIDFAKKLTRAAYAVTQNDIDALRSHELSDAEILDIAAAAAVRNFISRFFDALGAEPDAEYLALDEDLRRTLTVGRPFGEAAR
jgi:uncharacterized peroxidase-related enzyme